jgi:hypothetical protein
MKFSEDQIEQLNKRGIYLNRACDACGEIPNGTVRCTILNHKETSCASAYHNDAYFDDLHEPQKSVPPQRMCSLRSRLEDRSGGEIHYQWPMPNARESS